MLQPFHLSLTMYGSKHSPSSRYLQCKFGVASSKRLNAMNLLQSTMGLRFSIQLLILGVLRVLFWDGLQVVIGGGQEASQVTMSDRRAGKFEAKFFHKVISLYNLLLVLFCCSTFKVLWKFVCNHIERSVPIIILDLQFRVELCCTLSGVPTCKVLSHDELHYLCTACLIIVACTLVDGAQIFEEEIGGVKGHFGPINALAFNPDGRRCARLNFFLNMSVMHVGKKSSLQPIIHSPSSR